MLLQSNTGQNKNILPEDFLKDEENPGVFCFRKPEKRRDYESKQARLAGKPAEQNEPGREKSRGRILPGTEDDRQTESAGAGTL